MTSITRQIRVILCGLFVCGILEAADFDGAPTFNLTPKSAPPRAVRKNLISDCQLNSSTAILTTSAVWAKFLLRPRLQLQTLHCAEIDRNILKFPNTKLFRIKFSDDRIINANEMTVTHVEPIPNGFSAQLTCENPRMDAVFSAKAVDNEIKFGLKIINSGRSEQKFKVAFPHIDGIALSDDLTADYYLFPQYCGIICNQDAYIRSLYGATENAMWQMIDLYSIERGGGVYLRSDDPAGIYKGINLRKGNKKNVMDINAIPGRRDLSLHYQDALTPLPAIGIAFDYQQYTRIPGGEVQLPDAAIGTHPGNWKNAMKRYALWYQKTWNPRPYPSILANRWSGSAGHDSSSSLVHKFREWEQSVKTGQLADNRNVDGYEFIGWWTQAEVGPWNIPFDQITLETLGPLGYDLYKSRFFYSMDPVSKKMRYDYNLGDYDNYNPQWGGLPAFRQMISNIHKFDRRVTLYMAPELACGTTRFAQKYGAEYAVINPQWQDPSKCPSNPDTPKDAVWYHCMYNLCLNHPDFQKHVLETVARLCRETNADAIRLDVYGNEGYICLSPNHRHIFPEPGHNTWNQATTKHVLDIHDVMDKIRPGMALLTEYASTDHLAAALDGAASYDTSTTIGPLRPFPINLFRFYFGNCRMFQINVTNQKGFHDFCFFNADGMHSNDGFPTLHFTTLRENHDAFNGETEPLVETLTEHVFANRFSTEEKTVWNIMNYSGHTLEAAPILALKPVSEFHYVDLFTGKELAMNDDILKLTLKDRELRCVARLPKRLIRHADESAVPTAAAPKGATVTRVSTPFSAYKLINNGVLVDMLEIESNSNK